MAAIIARGADDLLLDGMVAKLTAFRDHEYEIDQGVGFDIERDRSQPWKELHRPLVNMEIESDGPDKAGAFAATVIAQLFVPALQDDAPGAARLYYLKEQVRFGLLALTNPDMGQTFGTVKIAKPQWTRIYFQDRELEANILAGSWTFQVTYAWEPEDISAPTLTDIQVNTGLWAAAYHFGGG